MIVTNLIGSFHRRHFFFSLFLSSIFSLYVWNNIRKRRSQTCFSALSSFDHKCSTGQLLASSPMCLCPTTVNTSPPHQSAVVFASSRLTCVSVPPPRTHLRLTRVFSSCRCHICIVRLWRTEWGLGREDWIE